MSIHSAPRDSGEPLVVLRRLTKVYEPTPTWMRMFARSHIKQPVQALGGVDLTLRAGQICAIVGPNGAGKTTLFRIMVGLTTPTSGSGTIMGLDVVADSPAVRQVVGWMPSEDRSLLMRATCKENLQLHGRLQGMTPREMSVEIPRMLAAVGLADHREAMVGSLSAGQKARVRLARALLPGPRVLILDEPTGAIDPVAAHSLLSLIRDVTGERGLAVLISSHRLEEIEALQSFSLLMDRGRVRFSGDLGELRDQWERPDVELTFADEPAAATAVGVLAASGIDAKQDGAVLRCDMGGQHGTVGDLLTGLGPLLQGVERVRELPIPLRDFIAKVYASGSSKAVEAVTR
jgi:ABC-2 type transport system ATP-binding protein